MKKLGLIAGCSHSAGAEIDGNMDSKHNREHSFGSHLCRMIGYKPTNIAINGATNTGIARSVFEWFEKEYDQESEVFVCIGWTESSRIEVPAVDRPGDYLSGNPEIDWYDETANRYYRVNFGWQGNSAYERAMIPKYQEFMAENEVMLQNYSATAALSVEYFLKSKNIPYVMCNTMHMFTKGDHFTQPLVSKLDDTRYYRLWSTPEEAFYFRYKELGYSNDKAQYWHHNEIPHKLFAEELYTFVKGNQNV